MREKKTKGQLKKTWGNQAPPPSPSHDSQQQYNGHRYTGTNDTI